jgi:uncharacterized protein YaiI (UPF0178 family)
MTKIRIIVDADSCPVKEEVIAAARNYGSEVLMVASFDHHLKQVEGVQTIQVDRSDQSVDLYIANHISVNHILITQDFGLATIGLAKRAIVLSNRGQIYSDHTIGFLLESRHEHAKKRRNGKHSKGPRPFTKEDRNKFLQTLTKVLENLQDNASV